MNLMTLREVQQEELSILLAFQKLCREHNLRLYLCGGTLLGAVRHRGFIPWDDDIDVSLPREDYERFLEIIRNGGLPEDYQAYSGDLGNAPYPFVKMVNLKTHIKQRYTTDDSQSHLWIDILPVDGLPENLAEVTAIYTRVERYRRLLALCRAKLGRGTTRGKAIGKMIAAPFVRMMGEKYWYDKINRIARTYPYQDCNYVGIITWGLYGDRERCLREDYEKEAAVEFEGHVFRTMGCWDTYLSNLYGDYMKLPPESQRATHFTQAWRE